MNTSYRSVLVLLCTLLVAYFLQAQTLPKREFRGAWIATVANIDWPSSPGGDPAAQRQQLTAILDKLASAGVNAVVFQVRPECDAMYFSSIEPTSYWLTGAQGSPWSYDPLTFAIDEAHKRGMELHAWLNPYRAERVVGTFAIAASHVTRQHPDWIITAPIAGNPGKYVSILDPGKAAVRGYDLSVIADIVRRYDVDGIHMDDYFYTDNLAYAADTATFRLESRGITDQGDWRRDNVNILIKAINDTVHAIKPWVKFGMSPRGIWRDGVPTGISGSDNYSAIWCDSKAWLDGQYVDYIAPQLYWKFVGKQDYGLLQPWWASVKNGRHLYPGLAVYRIGTASFGSAGEIANQLRFNRSTGNTEGSILYTTNNITSNLGGIADTLTSIINPHPALLPVMAWKDAVPPYVPRGIQYANQESGAALAWEMPLVAPDGDTASRYAIYRFDHYPQGSEFSTANNLAAVIGNRKYVPGIPVSAPPGGVYFGVTALDRNYNESDTSNIVHVTTPASPALAGPANGTQGLPDSVVLRWRGIPMASGYHLQIGTDSLFTSALLVNDASLVDTFKLVQGFAGLTKYYWQVRAGNAAGWGSYGAPGTFTTGFPRAATLVYPANVQIDVPASLTFAWNASTTATSYRFQISKSADFAATLVDTSNLSDTTVALGGLESYRIYFWRVKSVNAAGASGWSTAYRFRTVLVVSVEETKNAPTAYALSDNYPNPFNPTTNFEVRIAQSGPVTVKVYDVLGREIATLLNETLQPGVYTVRFDGTGLSSGVYFCRMTAGPFVATKRMLLVK